MKIKKNLKNERKLNNIKNKSLKKNLLYRSFHRKDGNSINIIIRKNTRNNLNSEKLKLSLSTRNLTEINTSKDKDKKILIV